MRRALGRLLGVVLTFALVSVLALAALTRLAGALAQSPDPERRLPLFFNPRPSNVHDRAELAMQRVASGQNAADAERELVRLGGAALPHVLPRLDALPPAERTRVALALAPIARRMKLTQADDLTSGEQAVAFWARFWQDHAFDFRPQVVRRLVDRVADRASALARDEIVRLDTYAVPELIGAIGRIRTEADVQRARRLSLLLAHVTGEGPVVDRHATVSDARAVARYWRRFGVEKGPDFTTLDGPSRLVAMFSQTVYGRWFGRIVGVMRVGQERQPVLGISGAAAVSSLVRYALALALTIAGAAAWVLGETRAQPLLGRVSRLGAGLLIALPALAIVRVFGVPASAPIGSALAVALTAVFGAAALSRAELASLDGGPTSGPAALRGVLRACPSTLPWMLSSLFGLELWLGLDGAATTAVDGVLRGDITPAMSLALGGALGAASITALADMALNRSGPDERKPALIEVGETRRRRLLWTMLGLVAVLALLGVAPALVPGWTEVAHGARALLSYGLVTLGFASVGGLVFGAMAASGPRALDALLVRAVEIASALPAFIWAAALGTALGSGILVAAGLGLLRAVDVAWLLRSEMLRRARSDQELALRSLGHYPLVAYYRQRLRPAALPALAALAMTPAWCIAVGAVSRLISAPALPGWSGWDTLLGSKVAPTAPSVAAGALLIALTCVLLGFTIAAPRRVGAFRASVPPPTPHLS